MTSKLNNFAEACYDMNSIAELEQALIDGPDATDMQEWALTKREWTEQVEAALAELKEDAKK